MTDNADIDPTADREARRDINQDALNRMHEELAHDPTVDPDSIWRAPHPAIHVERRDTLILVAFFLDVGDVKAGKAPAFVLTLSSEIALMFALQIAELARECVDEENRILAERYADQTAAIEQVQEILRQPPAPEEDDSDAE